MQLPPEWSVRRRRKREPAANPGAARDDGLPQDEARPGHRLERDPGSACPLCEAPATDALAMAHARRYRHCAGCGLVFLHSADRLDRAAEHAYYALHRNAVDDPGYRAWLDRLALPLQQRLHPGACGLDYGCGPGPALAAMLSERGFPCGVWDPLFAPDPAPLQIAYDFITCTEVLEHIHDPRVALTHWDRLLRPGGWLAVMTHWWQPGTDLARWHYARDPTHVAFYGPASLQWIARDLGWALELPAPDLALWRKPAAGGVVEAPAADPRR
jgi:SAM-dependent methyltransferase